MCKMTAGERTLESIELIKLVKSEEPDEVDSLKLVEQDGVLCLIGDDFMEYQEAHEGSEDDGEQ